MGPVSFIQRAFEDALKVGMTGTGNLAKGAGRSWTTSAGWKGRGDDIKSSWDFSISREAGRDLSDSWQRADTGWKKAGAAINTPFRLAHMGMGAVGDVVRGAAGTAGTVAGVGLGAGGALAGGAVKHGLLKPGWALTKAVGPGVAKGAATAGYTSAFLGARLGATVVGATGKALWQTRKSPLAGTAMITGAVAAGALVGNGNYEERSLYGSPYGGKNGQIKDMGYMSPEINGGAWALNYSKEQMSPQMKEMQERMDQQGGYEAAMSGKGPGGDTFGATGDLVFALNQLRQGGIF